MEPTLYAPTTEPATLGGFPFWQMMESFKESIERNALLWTSKMLSTKTAEPR